MLPIERNDRADIEPLWAVRANAKLCALRWPNILLFTTGGFWLFLAISGGARLELAILAGIIALLYLLSLLMFYFIQGINYIYVGSRHGISTCLCRRDGQDLFVVKHSMESYDYDLMTSVKIFELASGIAISIGQASAVAREGLSGFLRESPSSPLCIYDNPYKGLVFELDKTGVWISKSGLAAQDVSIDLSVVRRFIALKSNRIKYVPFVFLRETIFCYKEHAEMIVERILSSDRSVELQKSGETI
ncbi:MAG: hypothetical protein ACR65T_00240 [Methylocystis sp.]|uniref:hypothetical protein n=1 Tax=Methylocystis sp. TaxID=1911079 RepID=UPI003DA58D6F